MDNPTALYYKKCIGVTSYTDIVR